MKFRWIHETIALGFVFSLSCEKVSKPIDFVLPDDGRDPVIRTIVFVSDRETHPARQICTMNSDGTGVTRITRTPDDFVNPVFSPDGRSILAVSATTTDSDELWIMDAGGGNLRNLSQSPGDDTFASFSPDGSRIVFASTRDGNSEIYIMDSDGQNPRRLTDSPRIDHSPYFTAAGSMIVYCSTESPSESNEIPYNIVSMNIDGSGKTSLTAGHTYSLCWYYFGYSPQGKQFLMKADIRPHFSFDGSRIVFTSYDEESDNVPVYMMNADGTDQHLVYGDDHIIHPVLFAPGDQRIIFHSHRANNKAEIWDMDLDGSNQRILTEGVPGHVTLSEISPDGSQVMFTTDVPISGYRYEKIWVMSPNGFGHTRLTTGECNDSFPHYQPTAPDSP